MKSIPNYLTVLRLLLIPLFVLLMHDPSVTMTYAATAVFVLAAATDSLDGVLARRYGAISNLGKLLDPLADKLLVMAALVMLVAQRSDLYGDPWVPGWMVVMILAREIWVTGLRAIAASKGDIVAASSSGKVKSVMQMTAIFLLLLHDVKFSAFGMPITFQFLGLYLLLISIVVSYWSAVQYSVSILSKSQVQ